jgi:hypothetical protein
MDRERWVVRQGRSAPWGPSWSRRSGPHRRAADGQQPVSVTTGEPAREPWRIMAADPAIDGH